MECGEIRHVAEVTVIKHPCGCIREYDREPPDTWEGARRRDCSRCLPSPELADETLDELNRIAGRLS